MRSTFLGWPAHCVPPPSRRYTLRGLSHKHNRTLVHSAFVNSYICTRLAKPQPGVPTDYMNLNRRWAMQRALHGHADVHKGTRCEWAAYLGAPVSLQVPSMLGLLRALRRGLSVPRTITVDRISVPPNRSRTRRTSGPNRCARRRTGAVTPYRRVPHFAHPACPCRPPSPLFCVLC